MSNTKRFDGKGEIYAKARLGYPSELLDYVKNTLHFDEGSTFADIGSGTGIFSELLLNGGYHVYAVEPNADMRMKAEEKLGNRKDFVSVIGTDSSATLPELSVDCVTTAQAFHWFDVEAFKAECRRILKPDGKVIIIYNTRDETAECNKALADIHRKYCPDFQGFSKGMNEGKCLAFFNGDCKTFRTDNSRIYDRQGFINRALSSSYSLRDGDKNYAEYLSEIIRLFDDFATDGTLTVPIFTVAYAGHV